MRIYIAGRISGEHGYKRKFRKAEKKIAKLGHSPMNPALLNSYPEFSYNDYMDITATMQEACDAVFMLPGWELSTGASREFNRALERRQKIFLSLDEIPKIAT